MFVDYCLFRCSSERLREPSLFIRSQWIRPEDTEFYESMGYAKFKLLERNIPSERLLERIRAYESGRYDGNLARLILPYGFERQAGPGLMWFLRHFFRPLRVRPWKLKPVYELAKTQGMMFAADGEPIVIDAKEIPADFLSQVEKRHCDGADCERCGYCGDIAARAVRIDEQYRERVLAKFSEVESMVTGGDLWNV
jgi:hypothetical protein